MNIEPLFIKRDWSVTNSYYDFILDFIGKKYVQYT